MSLHEFKLPDVGEGLRDGEIVKWHVGVGDAVKAHQVIVDVQTDKAIVEIPAPVDGTVVGLGGEAGDVLAVGAVLATFEAEGESRPEPVSKESAKIESAPPAQRSVKGGRSLASPAVRKLALELGVDLTAVTGSGSRGQITRADVEAAKRKPKPAPTTARRKVDVAPQGEDRVEPLRGLRRRIATTIEAAWREIPHIYSVLEIDATGLVLARTSLAAEYADEDIKLTYMPFFVKACVAALQRHPSFNASIDMEREEIIYRHRCNIGFATATADGLVVPVIHDAERLSLLELASRISELAGLTRERRASVEQLSHGTFTISNFGAYGHGIGMPIIKPPEVAIAGFGRIKDAVVAVDGQPIVRATLPLVVTTDHRLNDGDHLGGFIDTLVTYLREPIRLLGCD